MIQPLKIKMKIILFIILGIVVIILISKLQKKTTEKLHEEFEDEIKNENKEKMYSNGLNMKEKESSDKFRKGLLFLNEIVLMGNTAMVEREEAENKMISLATEFPEIIYAHACDRLKKYNSVSSQDKNGLMYSLRDIIGEDMEQNIMNAGNEKKIDEYFVELIDSTVKMIKKL